LPELPSYFDPVWTHVGWRSCENRTNIRRTGSDAVARAPFGVALRTGATIARRPALSSARRTEDRRAMQENEADRERRLHELAGKLLFRLERRGARFSLYRDADVSKPVRHDELTLDEVEDILNTWKLRGPHGG
jgi:hypothetical protein